MPRGVEIIKSWDLEILPKVKERLKFFKKGGIKRPTLRAMFYALVSLEVLPNTRSYYQSLSAHTVTWRETNIIPIDCFLDQSRQVIEDFDDVYESPEEYVDRLIGYLEDAPTVSNLFPRWHNQPHYVEVWTEKNAQIGILRSILRDGDVDREVRIVPGGGYSGPGFGIDNVRRLRYWQRLGKKIHIRYFGDLDPSGEDIDEVLTRKFRTVYRLMNLDIKRVALTDELVDLHHLPKRPDPDTFRKLQNDPRAKKFKAKHNGELFQVEVDALVAIVPDEFRRMVLDSVDEFFDEDIYEQVSTEYSEDNIIKIVRDSTRAFLRRLG